MGAQTGYVELLLKQFTPTKLMFHFLFWTFHWGIFAYGWYGLPLG
jgi:NADPH oxidase